MLVHLVSLELGCYKKLKRIFLTLFVVPLPLFYMYYSTYISTRQQRVLIFFVNFLCSFYVKYYQLFLVHVPHEIGLFLGYPPEDTCRSNVAVLVCCYVICNDAPDSNAVDECKALGKALV